MKVKELLTDESKWIKSGFAKNKKGTEISPDSPEACQWCLLGAICKIYKNEIRLDIYNKVLKEIEKLESDFYCIGKWNDDPETTFEDLKELVNKLDI